MNGMSVRINPSCRIREWSSITGKGGGATKWEGGSKCCFTPTRKNKGGGGKCFSHPEWRVAKCFVLDVLTILEGGHKRFPPFDGGRGGA